MKYLLQECQAFFNVHNIDCGSHFWKLYLVALTTKDREIII